MGYIEAVNGFYSMVESMPVSPEAACLYHALIYTNNRCFWQKDFTVSNTTLVARTMLSESGFHRARNMLVQRGYISYKKAVNQYNCGEYRLLCHIDRPSASATERPTERASAKATESAPEAHPQTLPEPLIDKDKEKDKDIPPTPKNGFEKFWQAYPKKKAKADAEKAWKGLNAELSAILSALEQQKKSPDWQKDGGKFVPYPASWLRGKRWEDEQTAYPSRNYDDEECL